MRRMLLVAMTCLLSGHTVGEAQRRDPGVGAFGDPPGFVGFAETGQLLCLSWNPVLRPGEKLDTARYLNEAHDVRVDVQDLSSERPTRRRNDWRASTPHRSMRGWTNTVANIRAPESPMPPQGSSTNSPGDREGAEQHANWLAQRNFDFLSSPSSVGQRLGDVLGLQVGVLGESRLASVRQQRARRRSNSDAPVPQDAGPSAHYGGVTSDARQFWHVWLALGRCSSCRPRAADRQELLVPTRCSYGQLRSHRRRVPC